MVMLFSVIPYISPTSYVLCPLSVLVSEIVVCSLWLGEFEIAFVIRPL